MAPARRPPVTFMQDDSTHTAQNPLKDVIKPNNKPTHRPPAGVAARKEAKVKKENALHDDFTIFHENQQKEIKGIAEKHGQKERNMRRILTNASSLKATRAPSLYNALIHHKTLELNEGRPHGQRASIHEIREAVVNDPKLQNLSKKKQKKLIKALKKYRLTKSMGARSSNRAAKLDYNRTLMRFQNEFNNLTERTGAISFCFFTCTHLQDTIDPAYFGSDDALDFLVDVFNTPAGDVSGRFELWAVSRKHIANEDSLLALQKDCAKMINEGLNKILGMRTQAEMQYVRYDREIRFKYHVELAGWPSSAGEFQSPFKISTMFEIRVLRNALRSGDCHWIAMEEDEVDILAEHLKSIPLKCRARRSDYGKTRGPRKKIQPAEKKGKAEKKGRGEETRKKARVTAASDQVPPAFKSKGFISSSDESSDSSESGDDSDDLSGDADDEED